MDKNKINFKYFTSKQIVGIKERKPKHFVSGCVVTPEVSLEINTSNLSKMQLRAIRSAINLGALRIKLVDEDLPSSIEEEAQQVTGEL